MMFEFWKDASGEKTKTKKNAFGVLLADLSRAFSCLCHDLLIVKLHSYGLNISPLFRIIYPTVCRGGFRGGEEQKKRKNIAHQEKIPKHNINKIYQIELRLK